MTTPGYRYTRALVAASVLSLLGQCSAIAFMLRATPYTTFVFMTLGVGMVLLGITIFGYVRFREIRARTDSLTERHFRAGEFVFRQGDSGDRIYVVRHGTVEVVREDPVHGEAVVASLHDGEFFGEAALLTDAPRNASVRAASAVATLSIAREEFLSLYESLPAFHRSVETVMRQRRS